MRIESVTYQQVVNTVVSWIQTNCSNVANYTNMEACFKTGYSSGKVRYAGNDTSPSCYTAAISSNGVASVASSTVSTDMSNFLSSRGLTDMSKTLPASEFLDFVKNMVVFCSTKVVMVASQYSSTKYICYDTSNTTYSNTFNFDTNDTKKIVEAKDIEEIFPVIITNVRQNMRNKTCQYTITMSA